MTSIEVLQTFYSAMLNDDKATAKCLTAADYNYFGWDFEKHWAILTKEKQFGRYTSINISVASFGFFHQVLLNGSLWEEQDFRFIDGLLAGTNNRFDCFGKLVFKNYQPERVLNIRPKRGELLHSVCIDGTQAKGFSFHEADGFYSVPFALPADNMKTIEATAKIATNQGSYNQIVLLRGLDHVANVYKHIRLVGNGKAIKLNNDPLLIHKIEIDHETGKAVLQYPENRLILFHSNIKSVFVMAEGTAFNYLYDF